VLYTKAETAEQLRKSQRTVDRYIRDGLLKATKGPGRNGNVMISDAAIAEYLKRQEIVPAEPEPAAR
jgi:hypothetical protein